MISAEILLKNKILRKVWRAAHSQNDAEEIETSLPKICRDLDRRMSSEDMNPNRRMALRTSAVMNSGVTKIYQQKAQQLCEDVFRLDGEIIIRNKRPPYYGSQNIEDISSGESSREASRESSREASRESSREASGDSYERPEQVRQQAQIQLVASYESISSSQAADGRTYRNIDQINVSQESVESAQTAERHDDKSPQATSDLRNSSATLTSVFDFVAALPNNDLEKSDDTEAIDDSAHSGNTYVIERSRDLSRGTGSERHSGEDEASIETGQTSRTRKRPLFDGMSGEKITSDHEDEDSQASQRSLILHSANKKKTKRRRTETGAKRRMVMKDQASQTDPSQPRRIQEDATNENIPFGYLMVFDTYNFRNPTTIISSFLSPEVNNLIPNTD